LKIKEAQIKDKTSELRLLFEVSQALNGAGSELSDHLEEALALMARYTGMMRGAFYLINPDGETVMEAAYGLNPVEKRRARYKKGEGVIGRVTATGQAMVVPNVSQEPLFLNRTRARDLKKEDVAFICVSIILEGQSISAISGRPPVRRHRANGRGHAPLDRPRDPHLPGRGGPAGL
jgi:Nif-specific regulatory protein